MLYNTDVIASQDYFHLWWVFLRLYFFFAHCMFASISIFNCSHVLVEHFKYRIVSDYSYMFWNLKMFPVASLIVYNATCNTYVLISIETETNEKRFFLCACFYLLFNCTVFSNGVVILLTRNCLFCPHYWE